MVVSGPGRFKSKVVSVEQQVGKPHRLTTQAGDVLFASRVMVAVPMTAFRADSELVIRPRVAELTMAAAECNEGSAVKVILSFSQQFWDPKMLLVFCAESIVPQIWADPPRPSYSEACHVLTGFITGSQAKAASGWATWKIVDAFLKQLDLMFASKTKKSPATDTYIDHVICDWVTLAEVGRTVIKCRSQSKLAAIILCIFEHV